MRTLFAAMILALVITACRGSNEQANAKLMADSAAYTRIHWLDSIVEFDTTAMGEQVKLAFRFRNTGDKPLYLTQVKAGCGCTVTDYTREAVVPGMEGKVTAAFDTKKAHPGDVYKSIFVTANTKDVTKHTLIFTGFIKETNKR